MADLRYTVDVDTRGAQAALAGLRRTITNAGAAIAGAFTFRELTRITAQFEDLRITLGILYKDTEKGNQVFEQLKAFATQSVLGVDALAESVIKLKAAGLEPTVQQLQLFSNVASVSADRLGTLQAITDLYARTTAGGLGLEDLNRLADRGIPVFTILAEKLGINRLEISKLGETSEGAKIILRALEEGLTETFGNASQARIGSLSQGISNLQDALMNAADAVGQGGFAAALTEAAEKLTKFIDENKKLIEAIGTGLGGAINFVVENIKILGIAIAAVFAVAVIRNIVTMVTTVIELGKAFKAAAIAGAVLQGVTGVGLLKLAAGMAGIAGVVAGIEEMTGSAVGDVEELNNALDGLTDANINIPAGPLTAAPTTQNDALTSVEEQLSNLRDQQNAVTTSTINYFNEFRDGVNDLKRAVAEETALVGLSEQQANVQRELNSFHTRYLQAIRPLQEQVTELRIKDTVESRAQADEIERQIGLITNLYNEELTGLRQSLELREQLNQQEEARLLLLNNRRDLEQSLRDLERESQQALEDLNLNPFERQLADINRQVDETLVNSIRNIKKEWENGLITSEQYIAEIQKLEAEAAKTEAILVENATRAREMQRSFAFGWKAAFENYVEEATNAAKAAERIFTKVTQGMEDSIVNFAKTGKFEFRNFVADILETLLRAQIQQLIAKSFAMPLGGGGNILSGLGNLFSGFFANGGTIPAGTFGVVGEKGPELISGPATVTPFSGQATQVVYNINAVDAPSFKSMIARDPGFIHAVAQQGARKVPVRR